MRKDGIASYSMGFRKRENILINVAFAMRYRFVVSVQDDHTWSSETRKPRWNTCAKSQSYESRRFQIGLLES